MVTTLLVISGLLLLGCGTLGYCLWRVTRNILGFAKSHVNDLYSNHKQVRKELDKKKGELSKKEARLNSDYNKLKNDLSKKEDTLNKEYEKKRQDLENEYKSKKEELEAEVEEALKDAEEALEENAAKVDELLEDRLADITAKNTRMFNCLCSDKPIACFIDLTAENTYRCPDCGSVYRVEITMNPIMIGKAISDEEYVRIIKRRMEEEENADYEEI